MPDKIVHIVDDEAEICRATAFVMRVAGIPCRSWTSGEAFLEGTDLHAPGCVVLDLRMPGMDGMEVQSALAECGSPLSVIIVSGHADWAVARKLIDSGAVDFIEKPYDEKQLLTRVEEMLRQMA